MVGSWARGEGTWPRRTLRLIPRCKRYPTRAANKHVGKVFYFFNYYFTLGSCILGTGKSRSVKRFVGSEKAKKLILANDYMMKTPRFGGGEGAWRSWRLFILAQCPGGRGLSKVWNVHVGGGYTWGLGFDLPADLQVGMSSREIWGRLTSK